MTRLGVALTIAIGLLPVVSTGRAVQAPSMAELLGLYGEWLDGTRPTMPIAAPDLNAARVELARLAPTLMPQKAPADVREHGRRLITAFALELAASGARTQAAAAARLVEWACSLVRSHTPITDFDRAWQLAALSVLEGGIDSRGLAAHLDHAEAFLEPRQILARAIVEEQSTAPAEALSGQADALDAARATALLARPAGDQTRAADRAIRQFEAAALDDSLRAEARLRLGHVQLEMRRYDAALDSLADLETHTADRALIYLTHLFRGLAYDGRGRSADARAAYLKALDVSPGAHSATMRLAALAFRQGDGEQADRLLTSLLGDDDPRKDAWWSYYAADWRFWYPRIDAVRQLMRSHAIAPAADQRRGPIDRRVFNVALRTPQQPVFRSTVDAVTIQTSVRAGGRPVTGLTAADFSLVDNGVHQPISSVLIERVPIDVTVLLDLSGSVDGALLQRLKNAVRDTAGLLRDDDRMRLVSVSQVLKEVFSLRPPTSALPLDALAAEGATSLYDGLAAAMMHPSEPGRRQLVLAFTDGRDSSSIIDEETARDIARRTDVTVDIIVPVVEAEQPPPRAPAGFGTTIDSANVVTGSSTELNARARALQPWANRSQVSPVLATLVSPTAGQVLTPSLTDSITSAFRKMLDDFRASYLLQYVPVGVAPGGWHEVTVTVTKPGKYDIRARKGYGGPGEEVPSAARPVR